MKRAMTAAVAGLCLCAAPATGDTVVWNFDVTTTGSDVFFDPATPVNPNAEQFDTTLVVTNVIVTGVWNSIPVGPVDVTDEIPPEDLMAQELLDGPPPITVIEEPFVYPPPPDPVGFAATVTAEIDVNGFGHGSITDVTLGEVPLDVPPFGTITVTLTSVRVVGSVTVTEVYAEGDVDENGSVDVFDMLEVLKSWGNCPDPCPPSCPADVTNSDGTGIDCVVNVFDLLAVLTGWDG